MGYDKRRLQKALKQLSEDPDNGAVPVMAIPSSGVIGITQPAGAMRKIPGMIAEGVIVAGLKYNNKNGTLNKWMTGRTPLIMRDGGVKLKICLPNSYSDQASGSSSAEKLLGGDAQYRIQIRDDDGNATPIYTLTIPADQFFGWTDYIPVTFKSGQRLWLYYDWYNPAGIVYSNMVWTDVTDGCACNYNSSAVASVIDGAALSIKSAGTALMPLAVVGETVKPSILILGDSLAAGRDDTPDASGVSGLVSRPIEYALPALNHASPGDKLLWWLNNGGRPSSLEVAKYCSAIVCNYGRNDLGITPLATESEMLARIAALCAKFPQHPVYWCTYAPETTSTDSFATLENQTVVAARAPLVALNTRIRTLRVPGISGFIDTARILESSPGSGKWAVGYTADGVHTTPAANKAIAYDNIVDVSALISS